MPVDVVGSFASQKIGKIRWIPEDYTESQSFFTGSWDEDINSIKVWIFECNNDHEVDYPKGISEFYVDGNITEIKFTNKNVIAVSTSDGTVRLLEVSEYDRKSPLKELYLWSQLHKIGGQKCPCTALDTMEGDIATVGEDGNINILSSRRGEITRKITGADSCSIHSVCFIKHNQIISGNLRGHMKVWDLRSPNDKPVASFLFASDHLATTCVISHPTQPHYILAGSESGSLAVWDLRINKFPSTLLKAHAAGVTEMKFHPENPNKLLTSSLSGELWDWNMEAMTNSTTTSKKWSPLDNTDTMSVNSLLPSLHKPINSFDCNKGRILTAGENGAIYIIKKFKY